MLSTSSTPLKVAVAVLCRDYSQQALRMLFKNGLVTGYFYPDYLDPKNVRNYGPKPLDRINMSLCHMLVAEFLGSKEVQLSDIEKRLKHVLDSGPDVKAKGY